MTLRIALRRLFSFVAMAASVTASVSGEEPSCGCDSICPQGLEVTIHGVPPCRLPERIPVSELRRLEFVNVRLPAARLRSLLSTTRVRVVVIEGCPVGDEVCSILAGHPSLVEIRLVGTRVTDAGLEKLARLEALRTIDLRGTNVSPAGIASFLAASNVRSVDVRGIDSMGGWRRALRVASQPISNSDPDD